MGVGIKMSMYKYLKTYTYATAFTISKTACQFVTNAKTEKNHRYEQRKSK